MSLNVNAGWSAKRCVERRSKSYDDERPTGDELVRKLRRRITLRAAALFGLGVSVILIGSADISVFSGLSPTRIRLFRPAVEPEGLEAVGCSQTLAGGGRCVMAAAVTAKHMPAGLLRQKVVDIFGRGEANEFLSAAIAKAIGFVNVVVDTSRTGFGGLYGFASSWRVLIRAP